MVDIHCHILPEVDDGAKDWDAAAEMCRVAAADGVTHIAATPHANDEYAYDRGLLRSKLTRLQGIAGEWPMLTLGCDFHFSYENVRAALADATRFTIGNSQYLLVEFSDFALSPPMRDALVRLRNTGVVPIVTHPERNLLMQRDPGLILKLLELGCLVQVTASSLAGRWGESAQKSAVWLLEHEAVHVLASDAHDPVRRPPVLSAGREAAAKICGQDVARALVDDNPRAIINGEPVPFRPQPEAARPGRRR
ncbi:MAG TPA: CpsB/CapC family capsule biosynthesis tyrosine phosphatase [Terriglobales bacterium]|nr:CpsB/CapC family capsule biosynthesis tyrosine phosphatase [Terriglobales bacterium]